MKRAEEASRFSPYNAVNMLKHYTADSFRVERDRNLYTLLISENIHRMGITEADDSAIAECRLYYGKHHDKRYYGRALLHNGITLYSNGMRYRAIEMIKQAEHEASGSDNHNFVYDLNDILGMINNQSGNNKLAMTYYRKALAAAKSASNPTLTVKALNRLADTFDAAGMPDSMYKYIEECRKIHIEDNEQYAAMLTNDAAYRLYIRDTVRAEKLLRKAQAVFTLYKTQKLTGDIYAGQGHMEQACSLWYEAIFSPQPDIGIAACHNLTDHFNKSGQYKRAAYISQKLNTIYENTYLNNNTLEIAYVQTRYDNMATERQARRIQTVNLSAMALLAILILTFIVYHHRRIKSINNRYSSELLLYNMTCAELEKLQHLKEKDNVLIADKMKEIDRLQQRLAEYHDDRCRPDNWNMKEQILQAPEVMRLHSMAARNKKASDEDWAGLYRLATTWLPELMSRLNNTDSLNIKETNVCLLIRLRFIPSEIAILTDMSPQLITNMRVRMLFKIFGERGGARDFDSRIRNI